MPQVLCAKNLHFYNPEKYSTCPVCQEDPQSNPSGHTLRPDMHGEERKTEPIEPDANHGTEPITPDGGTITDGGTPVTGWLVIVSGPGIGKDYRLIQGRNGVGRQIDMEVCLDFGGGITDMRVSAKDHVVVWYDNNSNEFFVKPGESRNMPTLNGQSIRGEMPLTKGDIIQVGETKLLFVPLCGENFSW